jgi:hypothetical protein
MDETMIKRVEALMTPDGHLYLYEQEAKAHMAETALIKWFDEEPHKFPFDRCLSPKSLIEWLRSSESEVFRNFVATI